MSNYLIEFDNESFKQIACYPDRSDIDDELKEEIKCIMKMLKDRGEVTGFEVEVGFQPGVNGLVYEIFGRTINLIYCTFPNQKKIKIKDLRLRALFQRDDWVHNQSYEFKLLEEKTKNLSWKIPQYDKPEKIIQSLILIQKGIKTSEKLGRELGHDSKKSKDIARHGSYVSEAGELLKLVERDRQGHSYIYKLTESGKRIGCSQDRDTQERLLAEAMIGFYPIQVILEEITKGDKELEVELIKQLIDERLSPGNHKPKTSHRRAQCLRTWTVWLTRVMGIPFRRKGAEGVQLYIPYIYATK